MIIRDEVAARIRQTMMDLNLTQKQFAERLNISQPAVSLYLQGRVPPPEVLLRLARLTGKSMEWFLVGEKADQPAAVREPEAAYGAEAELLELWRELPGPVRQNLLALLRYLAR